MTGLLKQEFKSKTTNKGGKLMIDKLEDITMRYQEIVNELNSPDVASDHNRFLSLMKDQNELAEIVEKYNEYKEVQSTIDESLEILNETTDEEFRELAKEELNESKERLSQIEEELKVILIPKDPNDTKNVIVEIRSGASLMLKSLRTASSSTVSENSMDVGLCTPPEE